MNDRGGDIGRRNDRGWDRGKIDRGEDAGKNHSQDVEREELLPRCGEGRTIAKMWKGKNIT